MIANTLPTARRTKPPAKQPAKPHHDPVGVADVVGVLRAVSRQLGDVAGHLGSLQRDQEATALTRVAVELAAKAMFMETTGKLRTSKTLESIVLSLRSGGVVDRDVLIAMRQILFGSKTPSDKSMRIAAGALLGDRPNSKSL